MDLKSPIKILAPRWHDKQVLVMDRKIGKSCYLDITSQDANGHRHFPLLMYISGKDARTYPLQAVKSTDGKWYDMRVIPLDVLEPVVEEV